MNPVRSTAAHETTRPRLDGGERGRIGLASLISSAISREVFEANWFSNPAWRVADSLLASAGAIAKFAGSEAGILESQNKLAAFAAFRNPRSHFFFADRQISWREYVRRARAQGAYASIWLFEGEAARLSEQAGSPEEAIDGLNSLVESETSLDKSTWLPLYTGTGMAVARRLLENASRSGAWDIHTFFDRINILAARCRMPTYTACLHEAAGLVVQTLYPRLLEQLVRAQPPFGPERLSLFWHGVGRGLYFDPLLLPGGPLRRRLIRRALSAAPCDLARANLVAGYFWALALVNIRHPAVVTNFLETSPPVSWNTHAAAIADGIGAALMVWQHLTGAQAEISRFLNFSSTIPLWTEGIIPETRRRLHDDYDRLNQEDRIPQIFLFREA